MYEECLYSTSLLSFYVPNASSFRIPVFYPEVISFPKQRAITSLKIINWFVFVMELEHVF
jgi:hypothetical protein